MSSLSNLAVAVQSRLSRRPVESSPCDSGWSGRSLRREQLQLCRREPRKAVAEEMQDPVSREFAITFADLNYGNDVRSAMLGLLERMPSVTVMALVTSVLVQKETGGNLAEILDEIGKVIRGRFRLQRKIKTLSAEGRLSAWILAMIPFGLFAAISITTPSYLPSLLENPMGQKLIFWGFALMVVGIYWIRRIIRIDV